MAYRKHLVLLLKGAESWNAWRKKNPDVRPDLTVADLRDTNLTYTDLTSTKLKRVNLTKADLSGADLTRANLIGTDLIGANLTKANLTGAILWSADLTDANLVGANLTGARLPGANLTGARLPGANLTRANLTGANLTDAKLLVTHFHQVELREMKGLEAVKHGGPSYISSHTLEMSQGQIPEAFLKGCGFKDWAIESAKLYNPNLRPDEVVDLTYRIADLRTHAPIAPYSVFLSYSRKDSPFVDKVAQSLDTDGIRSWRDTHDLTSGPWEEQIDRAVGLQNAVVLVLSKESIGSKWVKAEVERAQEVREELEEKSGGPVHVLCPVALDNSWETDKSWPRVLRMEVQRYNILDFSRWEDDEAFEPQYQKLKKGLGIYYRSEGEG